MASLNIFICESEKIHTQICLVFMISLHFDSLKKFFGVIRAGGGFAAK